MATEITIDDFDLYPFLRVAPGDGLDLANPQLIEPHFANNAVGDGDILISQHANNREIQIPLHLSPKFTASYADTKSGLVGLVQAVNRVCAGAREIQWRDDGAVGYTYFRVRFARFEPEYNYRRSQSLVQSGILRAWVEPYGLGPTTFIISAGGSAPLNTQILNLTDRDTAAELTVNVVPRGLVATVPEGALVGFTSLPAGYVARWPAASIVTGPSAVLRGASGAAGSQFVMTQLFLTGDPNSTEIGRIDIDDLSLYRGRNRVFGLVGQSLDGYEWSAYDESGNWLGAKSLATINGISHGWQAVDLGVYSVDPVAGQTDGSIKIHAEYRQGMGNGFSNALNNPSYGAVRLSHVLVLPEESTTLILDRLAVPVAYESHIVSNNEDSATDLTPTIDKFGNSYVMPAMLATVGLVRNLGQLEVASNGANPRFGAAYISTPTLTDMTFRVALGQQFNNASSRLYIGKVSINANGTPVNFAGAELRYTNASQLTLSVIRSSGASLLAASAMSSVNFSSPSSHFGMWAARLDLRTQGPAIQARIIHGAEGELCTTIAGSHTSIAGMEGIPFIAMYSTTADISLTGHMISSVPSTSLATDNRYIADGMNKRFYKFNSASNFEQDLAFAIRGNYPRYSPSHALVGAIAMPLDGAAAHAGLSLEVLHRERFTYFND